MYSQVRESLFLYVRSIHISLGAFRLVIKDLQEHTNNKAKVLISKSWLCWEKKGLKAIIMEVSEGIKATVFTATIWKMLRARSDYSILQGFTGLNSWRRKGHDFGADSRSLRQGNHISWWRERISIWKLSRTMTDQYQRHLWKLSQSLQNTHDYLRTYFLSAELESSPSRAHRLVGLCWGSSIYNYLRAVYGWTRSNDVISCNKILLWPICSIPSWNVTFQSSRAYMIAPNTK